LAPYASVLVMGDTRVGRWGFFMRCANLTFSPLCHKNPKRERVRSYRPSLALRVCVWGTPAEPLASFKQQALARPAKGGRGQGRRSCADAGLATAQSKQLVDRIGERSFPLHARAETRVVELTAAQLAESIEHALLAVGEMLLQPLLEQW